MRLDHLLSMENVRRLLRKSARIIVDKTKKMDEMKYRAKAQDFGSCCSAFSDRSRQKRELKSSRGKEADRCAHVGGRETPPLRRRDTQLNKGV